MENLEGAFLIAREQTAGSAYGAADGYAVLCLQQGSVLLLTVLRVAARSHGKGAGTCRDGACHVLAGTERRVVRVPRCWRKAMCGQLGREVVGTTRGEPHHVPGSTQGRRPRASMTVRWTREATA